MVEHYPAQFMTAEIDNFCERIKIMRRQWLVFKDEPNFISLKQANDLRDWLVDGINKFVSAPAPRREL